MRKTMKKRKKVNQSWKMKMITVNHFKEGIMKYTLKKTMERRRIVFQSRNKVISEEGRRGEVMFFEGLGYLFSYFMKIISQNVNMLL